MPTTISIYLDRSVQCAVAICGLATINPIILYLYEEYKEDWDAGGADDDPAEDDGDGGVADGPHADAPDRVDDGQVAVEGQQDESVDGTVRGRWPARIRVKNTPD